jgi:hypothetical protein
MRDQKATKTGLTMSWVPVRDANGRVHMEAHWTAPATTAKSGKPRPHAA